MPKRIKKAIINMVTATAVAPAWSNCSSLVTITKGTISETNGKLPAIKMTDPYSPTARANAKEKPVSSAGIKLGKITR